MDTRLALSCLLSLVVVAWACGDDGATNADAGAYEPWWGGEGAADSASFDGAFDAGASSAPDTSAPAEQEELVEPEIAPAASSRFVFVANPSQNLVAKIDSVTFAVTPIAVGREPRIVQTAQSGDVAIVLNIASDSVSVIEARPAGDLVSEIDVLAGCNRLALAPDARYALAWYANAAAATGDRIGSLQSVALVDLSNLEAYDVSVGFNVRDVRFSPDGTRAFAVSDSGVATIVFDEVQSDVALPAIGYGDALSVDAFADREVEVAESGRFAVVSARTFAGVEILNLEDDSRETIELPGLPTDIDIAEGGSLAYVALRDEQRVARVRFREDGASDVDILDVPDAPLGSLLLSEDEGIALSVTTGKDDTRLGVIALDASLSADTIELRKPARGLLAPSADRGLRAIVLHDADPGASESGQSLPDLIDAAHALTLVDVGSRYGKLELLPSEPIDWVFTPDGRHGFLLHAAPASAVQEVTWVELDTFARRTIRLDAVPETIGVVPETGLIFISQDVDGGRITFIDPDTAELRHVSAFQLNAYID